MGSSTTNPLIKRAWYSATITEFLNSSDEYVLGLIAAQSTFSIELAQRNAWQDSFDILRKALSGFHGKLYFEFDIPRMGRRIDVLAVIGGIIYILEFKTGATTYLRADRDQAYDYALDLKNFHEGSHNLPIVPVLVATDAPSVPFALVSHGRMAGLYETVLANSDNLRHCLTKIPEYISSEPFDIHCWENSRYYPTPTIIEAARALYAGHGVAEISRSDAGAQNLQETSETLFQIIQEAEAKNFKALCFVTGVPGAGKTLVGLNIATQHIDAKVPRIFLSGNGPLVKVLREALARDMVEREKRLGKKIKKGDARTKVKAFIQNVHHFRDDYLKDLRAPAEHVALFDEAQRAWNQNQTAAFMKRKKKIQNFSQSEPEFLISVMDRHEDSWAVIVCLVGGGQEINTGEAGITAWVDAALEHFPHWHLYISPHLHESEYGSGDVLKAIAEHPTMICEQKSELHLSVSMRSFRSERVSEFVKKVLDIEVAEAGRLLEEINENYPIRLTRDLDKAKNWLREQASGNERYGIVVSSQAERLKPYAIDVKSPMDPVNWFLEGKDDVRSSYYLEDVATEFHVQGLELDWACVAWDGDFRFRDKTWKHFSFRGNKWQRIAKAQRQLYQKNAYRVLLTRARQGMVLYVPTGETSDPTRLPAFYDETYAYLCDIGLQTL
ncbi:MAG: DUF2075 domain-containing protein [Candidatus Hydrogenedens sp.]|nr:DUF2075 domain-containing protein [Candidatus Hydrogenedens sp.]